MKGAHFTFHSSLDCVVSRMKLQMNPPTLGFQMSSQLTMLEKVLDVFGWIVSHSLSLYASEFVVIMEMYFFHSSC